jgi:leucyl-tRNA synthetase
MKRYNPAQIEAKWQQQWEKDGTYKVDLTDHSKPKFYGFAMLPYPSGTGLHTGHVRTYTLADVTVRAKRQQGFNAYNPIGWDAFGLPAENYAIKTGTPPEQTIATATARFKEQLTRIGMSHDWSKEINTSDPEYYKWTQWIFTKLFEHGLAYQKQSLQWWCEKDQTVLANEQVINGKCWRHDAPDDPLVTKKALKQWFFKITDYADELLDATDDLAWPGFIKTMQKNWIGRSIGAEINFAIDGATDTIKVFTTRADTLFGATFLVLAPEHNLVQKIVESSRKDEVQKYVQAAQAKSDIERQETDREKTGFFTGAYAINPVNGKKIPIWVADYVLASYGTGAIMAVPAHDERDFVFAKKFDLPIKQVIMPCEEDSNNPPKEGYDEVARQTVVVHLRNKATGKFALLKWHGSLEGITTAIMGGVEPGQTPEQAALTEIKEEAAIENARIVASSRWVIGSKYCASHKGENRKAIACGFLAEVDNLDQQGVIAETEKKIHTLVWVDEDKVDSSLTPNHQKVIWQQLLEETALLGEGEMINSGDYDGMPSSEARERIVADLAKRDVATERTNYKIRDWLISRQRYWGAPIPIIHCPEHGAVAVPESQLPVVLPPVSDYKPSSDGRSPLAKVEDWVNTICPTCGKPAKRETDTMDGYACSSWYFLRYLDPHNNKTAWNNEITDKWMPIDFYNGADHAVSHLLYARFWMRFFHKIGLVADPEPVKRLVYNAYILATDGTKMSKSKGNVIDPLQVIDSGYGADALRVYEMFIAPYDMEAPWSEKGVPGTYRFLRRVWDIVQELSDNNASSDNTGSLLAVTHKTIKKVTKDIQAVKFNTAVAAMMEMVNELYKLKAKSSSAGKEWRFALESLVQLMAPFAPHIAEELWQQLGHNDSVHIDHWPQWDEALLVENTSTIVVQVNGKVRATIEAPVNISEDDVKKAALEDARIKELTNGKKPTRIIYVPGRLVNIVL